MSRARSVELANLLGWVLHMECHRLISPRCSTTRPPTPNRFTQTRQQMIERMEKQLQLKREALCRFTHMQCLMVLELRFPCVISKSIHPGINSIYEYTYRHNTKIHRSELELDDPITKLSFHPTRCLFCLTKTHSVAIISCVITLQLYYAL